MFRLNVKHDKLESDARAKKVYGYFGDTEKFD